MIKKLICVMALVVLLSACGERIEIIEHNKENNISAIDANGENKENDIKNQVSGEIDTTDDNSNIEPPKDERRESILGEWKPVSAKNENSEEVDLQLIWGTGIKYGGTLNIFEDGTYTEYIGIIGETDPLEGVWEINSDQIVLTSKTNVEKDLAVIKKDVIDVNYGEYIVRFERHKKSVTNK